MTSQLDVQKFGLDCDQGLLDRILYLQGRIAYMNEDAVFSMLAPSNTAEECTRTRIGEWARRKSPKSRLCNEVASLVGSSSKHQPNRCKNVAKLLCSRSKPNSGVRIDFV